MLEQHNAIEGLVESNNSLHKKVEDINRVLKGIDEELHPKYFNQ